MRLERWSVARKPWFTRSSGQSALSQSCRPGQAPLEARIEEICETRVRYGYRRVHVQLRREDEHLDESIVGRLPGPAEVEGHAVRIGPEVEVAGDELLPWSTRMVFGKVSRAPAFRPHRRAGPCLSPTPWTELLAGDEVLATAVLDRLLSHQTPPRSASGRRCRPPPSSIDTAPGFRADRVLRSIELYPVRDLLPATIPSHGKAVLDVGAQAGGARDPRAAQLARPDASLGAVRPVAVSAPTARELRRSMVLRCRPSRRPISPMLRLISIMPRRRHRGGCISVPWRPRT